MKSPFFIGITTGWVLSYGGYSSRVIASVGQRGSAASNSAIGKLLERPPSENHTGSIGGIGSPGFLACQSIDQSRNAVKRNGNDKLNRTAKMTGMSSARGNATKPAAFNVARHAGPSFFVLTGRSCETNQSTM